MIAEGTYKAKITEYGLRETLKKDLMLTIRFTTEQGESVNWTGLFSQGSEAATARTMKTLAIFGFNPDKAADLANGVASGVLDSGKEVEIVVIHESNEKGTTYAVVQYVNDTNKFSQITKEEAVTFFSNFSFKPGNNTTTYKAATPGATVTVNRFGDDIPF
jgi:hypothetical protein